MALIARSFADRYAELVAYEPTIPDMMLDVQRREVGERKIIEEQFQVSFKDMLHVYAVMITARKARTRGTAAKMNLSELALYKKETAVWFPAAPPRKVDFRTNRPLRAFPHAAFAELCEEERELRQWLYGVERRLRQNVEEACGRAWFFLDCLNSTIANENLSRQRLQRDEDEAFTAVRRRFFRDVPADYYRYIVVTRYGVPAPATEHKYDDDVEYLEEVGRMALEEEEEAAGQAMYQDLQDAFAARLFRVHHAEVIGRYEIEEVERNELFPLVAQCCREDFGIVFYHVPSIALHLSSSQPCLRALCLAQLQEAPRRTAAVKARMSWCPPPGGAATLDDEDEEEENKSVDVDDGDDEYAHEEDHAPSVFDAVPTAPSPHAGRPETARPHTKDAEPRAVGGAAETGHAEPAAETAAPPAQQMSVVSLTPHAHEELETVPHEENPPLHSHYAYEEAKELMPILTASDAELPRPVTPPADVHGEVKEETEEQTHPTEGPETSEGEDAVVAPPTAAVHDAAPEYPEQEPAAVPEATPEAHVPAAAAVYPSEAPTAAAVDAATDARAEADSEL